MTVTSDNVASVFGYTEIDSLPYSVNEFVCGSTLEEYVTYNGRLSDDEIRRITLGICSGLSAVHKLGIVHRDITPSNIIIKDDGTAVITDFGISRLTDASKSKDTQILGTAGYAAPEQFGFRQTSAGADIYAVGALINYMAEGVLPSEHLTDGAFRKIVLKCTRMEETKRFADAGELAAAIDRRAGLSLFLSRVPGFGGSKLLKAAAVFWYISVAVSSLIFLAAPGRRIYAILIPAFFILPPVIICDKSGRISRFCVRHNLSRGVRIIIKAALVYILLFSLSIIAASF